MIMLTKLTKKRYKAKHAATFFDRQRKHMRNILATNDLQKAVFQAAKGYLSGRKRRHIGR